SPGSKTKAGSPSRQAAMAVPIATASSSRTGRYAIRAPPRSPKRNATSGVNTSMYRPTPKGSGRDATVLPACAAHTQKRCSTAPSSPCVSRRDTGRTVGDPATLMNGEENVIRTTEEIRGLTRDLAAQYVVGGPEVLVEDTIDNWYAIE